MHPFICVLRLTKICGLGWAVSIATCQRTSWPLHVTFIFSDFSCQQSMQQNRWVPAVSFHHSVHCILSQPFDSSEPAPTNRQQVPNLSSWCACCCGLAGHHGVARSVIPQFQGQKRHRQCSACLQLFFGPTRHIAMIGAQSSQLLTSTHKTGG